MSLSAEWQTDIGDSVAWLSFYSSAGLLAAALDADSPDGPGVSLLSAADGSKLGTVSTSGSPRIQYHESADTLFVGTSDDRVYAVDPSTASVQWETTASRVGPVTDETAFLYGGSTLWAYRVRDGSRKWQAVLPDSESPNSVYLHDGMVLVSVGSRNFDGNNSDYGLVAIDPTSGDEQWYYRPGGVDSVTVDDAGIYTEFDSDDRETELCRINTITGVEQWSYSFDSEYFYFEATENRVYARCNDKIVAINRETGRQSWESQEYYDDEALHVRTNGSDDRVFGCAEVEDYADYRFIRFDPVTGRSLWDTDIREEDNAVDRLNQDGTTDIYVGTHGFEDNGTVSRLNESTGHPYWESNIGETISTLKAEFDPVLARTTNGTIQAIANGSGSIEWSFADESLSIISTTEDRVVLNGDDIYVLDRADGTLTSRFSHDQMVCTGDGALFVASDSTIEAYPVAESPDAFDGQSGKTNTIVFNSSGDDGGGTDVYNKQGTPQSTASSTCPNCSANLSQYGDVDFCPECGVDTSPDTRCPACDSDLSEYGDVAFCPDCGSALSG